MKLFCCGIAVGILILQQIAGMAQSPKIDSLKQVLLDKQGEQRFDVLFDLAFEVAGFDNKIAIGYIDDAIGLAPLINDSLKIVKAYRVKGQLLNRLRKFDESILVFNKILPAAKRNNYANEVNYALNSLAIAHTFRAEYDKALRYHLQGLKIKELQRDTVQISVTLFNVGLVYYKLGDYAKSLDYYERALSMSIKIDSTDAVDNLYINIGLCYKELGKFKEARDFAEMGLARCAPDCSDNTKMYADFAFAFSWFGEKQFSKAKQYFERSLALARKTDDKRFQSENLVYLARIYIERDNFVKAGQFLRESEALALKYSFNELLLDTYLQFSDLYDKIKDYKNLSVYQNRYILLKEKVYSGETMVNLAKLRVDFEEREYLQTIASQKQVLALQESALRQQRFLNITIGCIVVLFALVIGLLYKGNRNKRKINHLLDVKVHERTRQLQSNKALLQQAYNDLQSFVRSTSASIHGPLATIKGICYVAKKDIQDPMVLRYFQGLIGATDQLTAIVANMQQPETRS